MSPEPQPATPASAADAYFPPPDAEGSWRFARDADEIREMAGLDPEALALAAREQEWLYGSDSFAMSIVHRGVLAAEFRTFNVLDATRFDVWSVTKSFTSLAFGILLGDIERGVTDGGGLTLDSPAYDFIPEGHPLSDERKAQITVRHLLTMTSGILGHIRGRRLRDPDGASATGSSSTRSGARRTATATTRRR